MLSPRCYGGPTHLTPCVVVTGPAPAGRARVSVAGQDGEVLPVAGAAAVPAGSAERVDDRLAAIAARTHWDDRAAHEATAPTIRAA